MAVQVLDLRVAQAKEAQVQDHQEVWVAPGLVLVPLVDLAVEALVLGLQRQAQSLFERCETSNKVQGEVNFDSRAASEMHPMLVQVQHYALRLALCEETYRLECHRRVLQALHLLVERFLLQVCLLLLQVDQGEHRCSLVHFVSYKGAAAADL